MVSSDQNFALFFARLLPKGAALGALILMTAGCAVVEPMPPPGVYYAPAPPRYVTYYDYPPYYGYAPRVPFYVDLNIDGGHRRGGYPYHGPRGRR